LRFVVALVWTALLVPSLNAADMKLVDALRRDAELAEKNGNWDKACEVYEQLLTKFHLLGFREDYQRSVRHANLMRRHQDASFRDQVLSGDITLAFKLYGEVLAKLRHNYLERGKTGYTRLFQYGLEGLRFALDDGIFRHEHLSQTSGEAIEAFKVQLQERWGTLEIASQREAIKQVFEVALAARKDLNLNPVVTIVEFACGACSGLDEHTTFLTPAQLGDQFAALEGEIVGIGIEVAIRGPKVLITQVVMGSPAEMAGLKPNDWIISIDKKPLDNLTEDAISERLRGLPGSLIELEIAMGAMRRSVVLTRQVVRVPSVIQAGIVVPEQGIGYCKIVSFQRTTVAELDETLRELRAQGLKVLILDLRGNGGGVFEAAIQTTERFLPRGKIIVSTQSDVRDQNRLYRSHNADPLTIPVVLLVDADTASAAEIVAGALQDHDRAKLVGEATYGKFSIQRVLQLETTQAGIRITLARFIRPGGKPFNLNGVTPDFPVERLPSMYDRQLERATEVAIGLHPMRE
jgi:carboxyl-terminal processing protease